MSDKRMLATNPFNAKECKHVPLKDLLLSSLIKFFTKHSCMMEGSIVVFVFWEICCFDLVGYQIEFYNNPDLLDNSNDPLK